MIETNILLLDELQSLLLLGIILLVLGVVIEPIRKAIGLLLVIIGTIACLTLVGIIIGIPMILIGGILLFAKIQKRKT